MSKPRSLRARAPLAALALLTLSACVAPAPYGPKTPGSATGYTDRQLTANRYRVTFAGNSVTDRETVEDYLLRRSAEITIQAGYRWFMFDSRSTKAKTSYMSSFTGFPGWGGGGWYWHSWAWDAPFGPPMDMDVTSRPITRYHAYAEIVLLTDRQAENEPAAINARELLAHLGPAAPAPAPLPPPR